MRTTVVSLIGAGLLQPAMAWVGGPSFDCTKATHEVEQIVCKDDELAALDRTLADLYAVVLTNTPASKQGALKSEQRGWVKGRDDCWKADDKRACVKSEYQRGSPP